MDNFEKLLRSIFDCCNFKEISDETLMDVQQQFYKRLSLMIELTEYEREMFEKVSEECKARGIVWRS